MYGERSKSLQIAVIAAIMAVLAISVHADNVDVIFPSSSNSANISVTCDYDNQTYFDTDIFWGEQAGTIDTTFGGLVFGLGDGDTQQYGVTFGHDLNVTQISLSCLTFTNTFPSLSSNVSVGLAINRTPIGGDCKTSVWSQGGVDHPFNTTFCNQPIKEKDYLNFYVLEDNGPSIGGCVVSAVISHQIEATTCNVTVSNTNNIYQNITNITQIFQNITNISVDNQTIRDVIANQSIYMRTNGSSAQGNYVFSGVSLANLFTVDNATNSVGIGNFGANFGTYSRPLLQLGSGTSSNSGTTDLYVTNNVEIDGTAYITELKPLGQVIMGGFGAGIFFDNNANSGGLAGRYSVGNDRSSVRLFGASSHQNVLVVPHAYKDSASYTIAANTDPHFYVASRTNPSTSDTQTISIHHNTTDGVIETQTGGIYIVPTNGILRVVGNLHVSGNINITGCIDYNGGVLGTCV